MALRRVPSISRHPRAWKLHVFQAGPSAVERIQAAVKEAETASRRQKDAHVSHNASADFTPILPELRCPISQVLGHILL